MAKNYYLRVCLSDYAGCSQQHRLGEIPNSESQAKNQCGVYLSGLSIMSLAVFLRGVGNLIYVDFLK